MKKIALKAVVCGLMVTSLSGCIGQMATSGMVMKFNLDIVDNRYARAGLYMLLSPVYGFAASADLFVFNTIEFWTGTNPISGKGPAVADMPANAIIKINNKINKQLSSAPLKISAAEVKQLDANTLEIMVSFVDGKQQVLRGEKNGDSVHFFGGDQFITSVSIEELNEYASKRI